MSKAKRKAAEPEEELVVEKEAKGEEEVEAEDEKKTDKDAKDDGDGDGEDGVGEKERLKLIKSRRKQMLDDIRDEQNKAVAAAQERTAKDRLQFLLQQSEIYTHFMKPDAAKKGAKPSAKAAASPARRTNRITEKEEDDLLLQEAKTDAPAVQLTATPPFIKNAPMRDYQIAGLNWLVRLHDSGINGILADEMGLGKTLQTISFLGYLKHVRGISGPHLVVTPKSTLGNWLNEVNRWCPSLKAIKLHGNQEERAEQKSEQMIPGKFDILVTTYEIAIKEKAAISKFHYRYIVVDEAHRIKNEQSVLSQVVRLYKVQNRLLLTGTPLQNNLHELWALLNFLLPEVFASSEDFDSWFDLQGDGDKQEVVEKLHMVLRPFLLRRLKVDVEKSLPPKKETKLFVGLSEVQKAWYKKVLLRDLEAVNGGGGKGSRVRLLNIVMQLRKAANHPYLFDGAEPYPFETGEHLVAASGKLVVLDKLLPKLKAQGSRVLIFSQMTRLLDILEDYMLMRKWQYCRIDGSTDGTDRESQIDDFNKPNSSKFIFLLSTRAGGLGINLATADTVILYDSDWNPQVDLQAQDRAHRIGQKKQVNVYRFVTEGTIEEKIVERAEMKLHLDALVIQQGRLVEQNKAMSKDELLGMIKFGADQIFSGSGGTLTDEDIDAILARGQQKTDDINAKLKTNVQKRLLDFSLDGGAGGNLYSFEGVDYSGNAGKNKLLAGWIEPPKRERKTQGYGVNEYYRNALRVGEPRKQGPPRPPKQPVIHDFQFYPAGLQALLDKETAAFRKRLEWTKAKEEREKEEEAERKEREDKAAAGGKTDAKADAKDKDKDAKAEEEPDFGELTAEEEAAKAKMLEQGLSTWTRRDFNAFVRGCEHHGRKDFANIAKECERSVEDVKHYSQVFWSRGPKQIADFEKLVKRIEDGEGRIQRRVEMSVALDEKVARYKNPWESLKVNYGLKRGKQYIEEEDVFLVCMTQKLGYGNWDALKVEIRKAWQFRFNWFLKSRSPLELQRRVDTLIRLIEKENDDLAEKNRRAGGAAAAPKLKKAKSEASGAEAAAAAKKRGAKEERKEVAGGLSKRRRVPVASDK